MKRIFLVLTASMVLWGCNTTSSTTQVTAKKEVQVAINLTDIKDDKVMVTVNAPTILTNEITYHIPKTVPGTYSEDNYGRYIDDLKAYDQKGNLLDVKKLDDNSWSISKATTLSKITYLVNDTFDTEKGTQFGQDDIFSPAGSNIDAGKNILLNTHCFVGYFTNFMTIPYQVTVSHPADMWGATSMTDTDDSTTLDVFTTGRYAELVENPIMYSKPDHTSFTVDGMEINIAVYSPTGKVTAESITPEMKTMMTAQKHFLGKINATKKYSVLLYLSTMTDTDAKGFGALEHPTATTVVLPEIMPKEELVKSMMDVVSHEFFHIVTPLTIHSKEIQYFDYNNPKMSEHLWMYEGVTEYFANLFQINQGLISEEDFYGRLSDQIAHANAMNDTMSFTTMSKNVLVEPYKAQYINVYQKGSLIGMCIDLIIREKSNGERGILDLMHKLSTEYGVSKPFNDEDLFAKITSLTYPEVGEFLNKYLAGTTPIPYGEFLSKVGVKQSSEKVAGNVFLKGQTPYITVNPETKEIMVLPEIELNPFFTALDLKGGDIIVAINDKPYSLENIYDMIGDSQKWKEDDAITVKIKRGDKNQTLTGKVKFPYEDKETLTVTDPSKSELKNAWLKN
ncbi:putative metalloprotease with PDZ domain [Flavobacterium sp. 28A]|uniref:M61 family metallopeptidase n=1 Tax=Flavobacterium sp. 28A TaxID=2735895 RepID=UPI00156E0CCB|nr:peptidase M61 [Flavobacterium sp. 28A]NRT15176.1 putative metalloprotease with PDZ domain [Flavobacterium sp. 28A]